MRFSLHKERFNALRKHYLSFFFFLFVGSLNLLSCDNNPFSYSLKTATTSSKNYAKFEPADGKVILFVGQELEAIGGLDDYSDGYLDYFERPAGWTAYTNLSPGDTSFGFVNKGLDGIWSTDNWGDSFSNMSLQLGDPDFEDMALAN